jgi:hypothetical protein
MKICPASRRFFAIDQVISPATASAGHASSLARDQAFGRLQEQASPVDAPDQPPQTSGHAFDKRRSQIASVSTPVAATMRSQ